MTMTEEEAKTQWCPFVRNTGDEHRPNGGSYCIASDCMAWRFGVPITVLMDGPKGGAAYKSIACGYCGLAGKSDSP